MVHVHPCPSTWTLYLGPIRMGVFLLLGLNQSGGWPAWDGECNQQKWFPKTNTIMEERYIYIVIIQYIYIYMNVVNLMHILTSRTLSKSKSITLGLSRLVHAVNPSLCFKVKGSPYPPPALPGCTHHQPKPVWDGDSAMFFSFHSYLFYLFLL